MPHVLVAPDSFKGTFSSPEVADAVAAGLRASGVEADLCPAADGGEGTLDALLSTGGRVEVADVHDPLGRPIRARLGLLDAGGRAVVEMAEASGLGLVPAAERDAVAASTAGTGELVVAAVAAGARDVLVTVGGSATTDGGAGAIEAIRDAGGLRGARLTVLCDVTTPFERAAEVYGPQKGAGPQDVDLLRRRLDAAATALPRDPRGIPMSGAAGGLAGGLWAAFGAELVPGAPWVLDVLGFDARLAGAASVVTGEGRLDGQTAAGKLIDVAGRRARAGGRPVDAIVGSTALTPRERTTLGLRHVLVASTREELVDAGRRLGELVLAGGSPPAR